MVNNLPFHPLNLTDTATGDHNHPTSPPSLRARLPRSSCSMALGDGERARNLNVAVAAERRGLIGEGAAQMDTKWQFGQLLENVQSRQPFHRTFLLHPKKPLLRRLFRMFTKPDRRPPSPSLPLLWRNPLFDPPFLFFPNLPRPFPPSSLATAAAVPPPSLCGNRRVRRKLPKSSFVVVVVVSLCRSAATVNFSQLLRPSSAVASLLARPDGRGLQGSLNLLRPRSLCSTDRATIHRQKVSYSAAPPPPSEWSNIGRRPCSRLVVTLGSQYWARGEEEEEEGRAERRGLRLGLPRPPRSDRVNLAPRAFSAAPPLSSPLMMMMTTMALPSSSQGAMYI